MHQNFIFSLILLRFFNLDDMFSFFHLFLLIFSCLNSALFYFSSYTEMNYVDGFGWFSVVAYAFNLMKLVHGLNINDAFLDYMTLLVSTCLSDIYDDNGARARNRSKACCKALTSLVGINIQSPQSYNCSVHQTLE